LYSNAPARSSFSVTGARLLDQETGRCESICGCYFSSCLLEGTRISTLGTLSFPEVSSRMIRAKGGWWKGFPDTGYFGLSLSFLSCQPDLKGEGKAPCSDSVREKFKHLHGIYLGRWRHQTFSSPRTLRVSMLNPFIYRGTTPEIFPLDWGTNQRFSHLSLLTWIFFLFLFLYFFFLLFLFFWMDAPTHFCAAKSLRSTFTKQ
jgi:hypothetical protein